MGIPSFQALVWKGAARQLVDFLPQRGNFPLKKSCLLPIIKEKTAELRGEEMKHILSAALVICLFFCLLPLPAAANNACYLKDVGIHVSIPDEFTVLTQDLDPDDPNLAAAGIDGDWLVSNMQKNHIYLDAIHQDASCEITITVKETDLEDFSNLSDKAMESMADQLLEVLSYLEIKPVYSKSVRYGQAKYAKFYMSNDGSHNVTYLTVHCGRNVAIGLNSLTGEIDPRQEAFLEAVVESIRYETPPLLRKTIQQTPSFVYNDPMSLLSFTVPENWVSTDIKGESSGFTEKFVSAENKTAVILYGCHDAYPDEQEIAEYSFRERYLLVCDTLDNTSIEWYIEEMYGKDDPAISMTTYGEHEYYLVEYDVPDTYPLDNSLFLIRNDHGIIYTFYFSLGRDDPHFSDFEDLISSANYFTPPERQSLEAEVLLTVYLIWIVVMAMICILPIIIYRYVIRKAPVDRKKGRMVTIVCSIISALIFVPVFMLLNQPQTALFAAIVLGIVNYWILITGTYPESGGTSEFVCYCSQCGAKISAESYFCHICGATVSKEK